MLGWHISVYTLADGGGAAGTWNSVLGTQIAVWQTGLGGLEWLKELAAEGRAVSLGGDGYPCRFTAKVEDVAGILLAGPPLARSVWRTDPGDVVDETRWVGGTAVAADAFGRCRRDEWLVVEAWDES